MVSSGKCQMMRWLRFRLGVLSCRWKGWPVVTRRTVYLYRQRGATSVTVSATIDDRGALLVEGYDIGEAPERAWGDSDYEYEASVEPEHKAALVQALLQARGGGGGGAAGVAGDLDPLLLRLIEERFAGNPLAFSAFREFCEVHAIPTAGWSWA
jgi:hypothetical protein